MGAKARPAGPLSAPAVRSANRHAGPSCDFATAATMHSGGYDVIYDHCSALSGGSARVNVCVVTS